MRLLTPEGDSLEAPDSLIRASCLLQTIHDEDGHDGDVPLPNVSVHVLRKVIYICENETGGGYVFTGMCDEDIVEVMHLANYLNMPLLLDACCAHMVAFIKSKTPDEIAAWLRSRSAAHD